MDTPPYDRILEDAVSLAETWQNRANALLTAEEKGIAQQMEGLVTHPPDKVVLTQLIDQSFRSENAARVADQTNYLLEKYGVPDFFPPSKDCLPRCLWVSDGIFPVFPCPR